MKYPKEFENLINTTKENLIGWGNPNAKILIIACEPSLPKENVAQIEHEIEKNKIMWQMNIECQTQLDEWLHSFKLEEHPCKELSGCSNYNPIYPYYGQKNSFASKRGGTSRSWWCYQKMIEEITKSPKQPLINFFQHCFVSDLSAENAINQNETIRYKTKESIENRINVLFWRRGKSPWISPHAT